MILLFPSLCVALYVSLSGVFPLRISRWIKLAYVLLVFLIALKYQFYTVGSGTFLQPSVSRSVLLVFEALYGALVIFAFILVIKDLSSLALWFLKKWGVQTSFSLNRNPILLTIAFVSFVAGAWGTWESIRVPDVKRITINLKHLPQQWKGAKIVQLSDLHIGLVQGSEWLSEVVKRTNALKPDLILITGDFVDGTVQRLLPQMQPLRGLKATYGVYGIPGNHEYYSGYRSWMTALSELGVKMLENEHAVVNKNGADLVIGGTTDYGAYRMGGVVPNLRETFNGTDLRAVRILLTHQPKTTHQSTERFDLQLSGHTHGGHMFFLHPLIAYFNDGMVRGLYQRGERQIYVNSGAGLWNGFSQRIFVPSEITEITLQ